MIGRPFPLDVAAGEAAVHRVVLEHVGEGGVVGQVVDRDELEVRSCCSIADAGHTAADASETVDGDANCHS
jgi:hypothetical protein